jgi:hypothetical protein
MSGIPHKNYKPTAEGLDKSTIDDGWQTSLPATPQSSSLYNFDNMLTTRSYDSARYNMVPSVSKWTVGFGAPVQTYDSGVFGQAAGMDQLQTVSVCHPPQSGYDGIFTYDQAPLPSIYQQQPSRIDIPSFHGQEATIMTRYQDNEHESLDCLQTPTFWDSAHPHFGNPDGNFEPADNLLTGSCTGVRDDSWRSPETKISTPSYRSGSGLSHSRRSPRAHCNPLAPTGGRIQKRVWQNSRVPESKKSDPLIKGAVVDIPHCTLDRYSRYLAKTKPWDEAPTPADLRDRAIRAKHKSKEWNGFVEWAADDSGNTNRFQGRVCWECFLYTGKFHPQRKRTEDAACRCEWVTQATSWKFPNTAKEGQLCFPIHEFEKTIDMHQSLADIDEVVFT